MAHVEPCSVHPCLMHPVIIAIYQLLHMFRCRTLPLVPATWMTLSLGSSSVKSSLCRRTAVQLYRWSRTAEQL